MKLKTGLVVLDEDVGSMYLVLHENFDAIDSWDCLVLIHDAFWPDEAPGKVMTISTGWLESCTRVV